MFRRRVSARDPPKQPQLESQVPITKPIVTKHETNWRSQSRAGLQDRKKKKKKKTRKTVEEVVRPTTKRESTAKKSGMKNKKKKRGTTLIRKTAQPTTALPLPPSAVETPTSDMEEGRGEGQSTPSSLPRPTPIQARLRRPTRSARATRDTDMYHKRARSGKRFKTRGEDLLPAPLKRSRGHQH